MVKRKRALNYHRLSSTIIDYHGPFDQGFKVAEHSFSARFCRCNLASAQGRAVNRAIILFTQHPHYLCYFGSITACSVLMALVFYYNDMLENVTMQRTQQLSGFVCYPKNPVKCNARALSQKIETDCFSTNVPISNDPVVRFSRNLAKKLIRDHVNDLS